MELTAAKREVLQISISPTCPKSNRDNPDKVREQNNGVDCQASVHVRVT